MTLIPKLSKNELSPGKYTSSRRGHGRYRSVNSCCVWMLGPQTVCCCLSFSHFLSYMSIHLVAHLRRRQWHPTPVLLPRKSHGRRSLVGCSPWGRQSRTRLSDFTFTFHFHALEKEMATHSSVLAWRISGTGSLVGFRLWGRTESDTTKATQQQQHT